MDLASSFVLKIKIAELPKVPNNKLIKSEIVCPCPSLSIK